MNWKLPCLLAAIMIMSACSPLIGPAACNGFTRLGVEMAADAALGAGDIAYDVMALGCDG